MWILQESFSHTCQGCLDCTAILRPWKATLPWEAWQCPLSRCTPQWASWRRWCEPAGSLPPEAAGPSAAWGSEAPHGGCWPEAADSVTHTHTHTHTQKHTEKHTHTHTHTHIITKRRITMVITMTPNGTIQEFSTTPHCVGKCLQHVRSSGQRTVVCKSTDPAVITYHMLCATCYIGTAHLLTFHNCIYLSFVSLAETINRRRRGGNQNIRRKPPKMNFRKCHV